MGKSKELLLRMTEEDYFTLPTETRSYLNQKIISSEMSDWNELMNDELYSKLYKEKKKVSKDLDQRTFDLREQKRKINNLEVKL